jgi:hypothetical protein
MNGEVRLHNTIIAGNSDPGYAPDCTGQTITSDGYNLIGTTTGCSFSQATGDIVDQGVASAGLGALADNGGTTQTHALLSGSMAIDAGDPSGCTDASAVLLTTDQTGGSRTIDGDMDGIPVCDIGAYEFGFGLSVDTGNSALVTTEGMGTASFEVVLVSQPSANVTVPVISSDTSEGTVSVGSLIFTPTDWNVRQQVVITGVDDSLTDGDVGFTVAVGPTTSSDTRYDNLSLSALSVTNLDNEGDSNPSEEASSGGGGAVDLLILLALATEVRRRRVVSRTGSES